MSERTVTQYSPTATQADTAPDRAARCPVCREGALRGFFEASAVPVHCSVLWPTRGAALACPTGEIRLGFCPACGMISNSAFDPALVEYTPDYENSLSFSPQFQRYAEGLARRLVSDHALAGKDVIEIGCGKGEFLDLLCGLGVASGLGFDASYDGAAGADGRVRVVREGYSARHTQHTADLFCCRQVLEHLPDPREILSLVRGPASRRAGSALFFEVPNALFTLRDLGIWDIIYAHCSYFTSVSLTRLFTECGFERIGLTTEYEDQFLGIEARVREPGASGAPSAESPAEEVLEIESLIGAFGQQHRRKTSEWRAKLARLYEDGARVVIWGSGAKGVTFLSTVDRERRIEYAVDLNPRKHGKFVPLSGQEVIAPDRLKEIRPDAVIVMNPIYRSEILEQVRNLSLRAKVLVA